MFRKIKSFWRFLMDPNTPKWFVVRYSVAQLLAYIGIGKYIAFTTPYYKLFLTASPVAMVLFGNPKQEREEERWLTKILRKDDVVIDAGANIGTFALKAAALVGEKGQVFAYEAHPATVDILKRNVQLNRFNNINIKETALGDQSGHVYFSDEIYDDVNHVVKQGGKGQKVTVSRLDDDAEIRNLQKIRCVKIDVEGYELPLLQGAEATISKTDYIFFEAYAPNCRRFGYELNDLFSWFIRREYELVEPFTGDKIDISAIEDNSIKNVVAIKC